MKNNRNPNPPSSIPHSSSSFSEKTLVEDFIIQKLTKFGWKYVPPEELDRESLDEPLLVFNLIENVRKINEEELGEEEIKNLLNELRFAGTGHEGVKRILNFFKFGVPVKFEKDKVLRYIKLFDYENIKNNEFIVTNQISFKGKEKIRNDIVLFVNGIPLVNIECKDPTKPGVSWVNAYRQIKNYEKLVPELYKYIQIGVAAESIFKYFPIVPWQEDVNVYEWKDEEGGKNKSQPPSPIPHSSFSLLRPSTLLDIIRNFLFFRIEHGNATKVIARYMQYRAANKIVKRVKENLSPSSSIPHPSFPKTRGLIWHWQGSGKTLTMIFAAHKLYYDETLENPTIFFIVDRIELEDQLLREFNALDIKKPEVIDSVESLKDVLRFDNYKGRRDIFITLIHKFRKNELSEVEKEMKRVSLTQETLMTRRNVICFIDEGHRTQYGILAAEMKNILKNAFFFAFTGTPLSKKDRNTYMEFSYPPEELYLDRYFIVDSINDGFTVKIVYKPRLEKEVHLRKEELETFLKLEQEEIPEDLKEIVDKKVRKRISKIKVFFENPERIEKIAKDIAEHFKENVNGKFKAMVVVGSRKACWFYFKELLKYLPADYIEVVMTASETENKKYIRDYVSLVREKYPGEDIRDKLKEVITKFKEEENPKILIVTDMLLTGFDAPILQVMYLDKPLKEHRLLQAIARTNRPYKDLKEAGIIIDYVGILKEFKKAFEIYSGEDIKGAILNYKSLEEEFEKILNEIFKSFRDIPRDFERETLLKAIEVITLDKKTEEEFVKKYRKLRKLYEILGSREIKLKYLEEYKWLSGVYTYYMKMVRRESEVTPHVKKYFEKTIKLIHETIEIEEIDKTLPVFEFGAEFLKKLEEKVKSKKEKAANILFMLQKLILVEKHKNPVYGSLVDRVERLVKMWRQKKKDYERLSVEGERIWKDMNKLLERRESLGMDNMEYAMLLYLEERMRKEGWRMGEKEIVKEIKELSLRIKKITFPGWVNQITVKKEVGREVRRFVRKLKAKYGFAMEEMEKIYEELFRKVVDYGE